MPSQTYLANIAFHKMLAPQYEQQPFFQESNCTRVRGLLQELAQSTPGQRLLDVGCGTGLILDLAHDLFKELDGIDITQEMLDRVKPRANVKTQLATAESIPFPDATFDAVTAYSVLHHIEDLGQVFREVRRTLKPGGFFYADESPSQYYMESLFALDPKSPMSDLVCEQRNRVAGDTAKYTELYGIPAEIAEKAMTQNSNQHALKEDKLRCILKDSGFTNVQITYRRFLGETECYLEGGQEPVDTIYRYLNSVLPMSRNLFKYFVLVAR